MMPAVMKKIICLAIGAAFCAMAAAADLNDIKVYINPGHGGWNEMNDRHVVTIPFPQYDAAGNWDTLGFWESSSNLKVAFDLRELLEKANAEVMMSRVTNQSGTRDDGELDWDGFRINYDKTGQGGKTKTVVLDPYEGDRSFSMMREECHAFNADLLLSIHSNASSAVGQAANYVACFLPGTVGNWTYKSGAVTQASVDIANKVYYYMYDNPLDCIHEGTRDDTRYWTFTTEYSLLNSNNGYCASPVVLCEASFHSYLPNTHRFLNRDYQTLEAYRFYRALCDYWHADFPDKAIIAGDVRSKNFKETRNGMGSYITKPTNIDVAKDKWQTMDGTKVELMQNGQVLQTYITDNNCNGIYVFYNVEPGDYQVRINARHAKEEIIDVTAEAGFTTTSNVFVTDSAYLRPITPDYPDQAEHATVPDKFVMNEYPVHPTPFLDGMNIRRMLTRGEKTYVLNDQSQIFIVNTYTGEQIGQLSTAGATAGLVPVSDIAFTSDTVLLACNKATVKKGDTKTFVTIYKWADDASDPEVLYTLSNSCSFTEAEVGETFTVTGNVWWHQIFISAVSVDSKRLIAVIGAEYLSNEAETGVRQMKYMMSKNQYTEAKWGTDYKFLVCPTEDKNYFIADSRIMALYDYCFDFNAADKSALVQKNVIEAAKLPVASYGVNFLQYAGQYMMLVPVCDANGLNTSLQLFRMTLNKSGDLLISVAEPLTDKLPANGINTAPVDFMHSASVVEGEDLNLVLYMKGLGIYRYSTKLYEGLEQTEQDSRLRSGRPYDLLGRPADNAARHTVIIRDGQKTMQMR